MAFNGTEGHAINPIKAAEWTGIYREANPGALQARFFGRDVLLEILKQPGCQGIRFYYGLNYGEPQLVAVGADKEENDQLGEELMVANDSKLGPPHLGMPNMLNS